MERLTDDRFLKDGFYQPKSKEEEKEIRSMGNALTFEKLYKHCAEVEKQNAELQKQVDELKAKQVIECHGMLKGCDMVNQAVKETAKEIFPKVKERLKHLDNEWEISNALYPLEQEYLNGKGVEVE